MSESLSRKIKKSFVRTSLALCTLFAIAVTMAGCGDGDSGNGDSGDGDSADGSTPAKYFRYEKKGNVKDGEYIVIRGLNTVSDEIGNPKVNLEDIWKKYKGKIVIPSRIEGMPVREIDWDFIWDQGGVKAPNTSVYIMNALDAEKAFYSDKEKEYNKLVTEVVFPEGLHRILISCLDDVMTYTIPLSVVNGAETLNFGNSVDKVVIQGSSKDDSIMTKNLRYPNSSLFIFGYGTSGNITFPECVKKVNLALFWGETNLTCSADAEFYYDGDRASSGGFKSKNPTEVIKKMIDKNSRIKGDLEKLTINGKKVLE